MTELENVILAAAISKSVSKNEIKKKAMELLSALGIDTKTMNRVVTKVSGGTTTKNSYRKSID